MATIGRFEELVDESIYTINGACAELGVHKQTWWRWMNGIHVPNKKNWERIKKFMDKLRLPENKRMQKHPSYGYAYTYQIERLMEIGIGPERTKIMSDIEKQNRAKGKNK